jgi:hypothetical protein
VVVTSLCLNLWFWLNEDSLYIDEEDCDIFTGNMTHTIVQFLVHNGDVKHWLLKPKKFRVYGLSESIMVASTKVVTYFQSSVKSED